MHIKNTQQRHRHLIGIPLVASVILATTTVVLRGGAQTAFLLQTDSASTWAVPVASDARLVPADDADITQDADDIPRLTGGSALCVATGLCAVRVANAEVWSLHGGAYVAYNGDAISVAAITAPLLVRFPASSVLVPVGFQWTGDTSTVSSDTSGLPLWHAGRAYRPVPAHFLMRQIAALRALPAQQHAALVAEAPPPYRDDARLLPSARLRRYHRWVDAVLTALTSAVGEGDIASVQAIIANDAYTEALQSPAGIGAVAAALGTGADRTAMHLPLLSLLASQPNAWQLAAVHPTFHAAALSLLPDNAAMRESGDPRLPLVLTVPDLDRIPAGLSVVAARSWQTMATDLLRTRTDAPALRTALSDRLRDVLLYTETNAYPERAQQWRERYRAVLQEDAPASQPPLEHQEPQMASTDATTTTVLPDGEVRAIAEHMLTQARAVFTTQTSVRVVQTNVADIDDVVFAGSDGDVTYAFRLDAVRASVSQIRRGEQSYPYAMPWADFLAWVRR